MAKISGHMTYGGSPARMEGKMKKPELKPRQGRKKRLIDCVFCSPNVLTKILEARVGDKLRVCKYHAKH